MNHLAATDAFVLDGMRRTLRGRIGPSPSLESAAGVLADVVYSAFQQSVILVRVFTVLPQKALPPAERVYALYRAKLSRCALDDDSPVLVLMATRGVLPVWNDRRNSRSHLAIPLASRAIQASPMIALLLRELGAETHATAEGSVKLVGDTAGTLGTFYVVDARTSVDDRGRRTIPAQDFVNEYDVRSVVGVGGSHGAGTLFAVILFVRQHVTRSVADRLVPLASDFVSQTMPAVIAGKIFNGASNVYMKIL